MKTKLGKIIFLHNIVIAIINIMLGIFLQCNNIRIYRFYDLMLEGEPLPPYSSTILLFSPYILYIVSLVMCIFLIKKIKHYKKIFNYTFIILYTHLILYFLIFSAFIYPTCFMTFSLS